jgi:hypothetical protein
MFYIARGRIADTPQQTGQRLKLNLGVTAYKISKSKKTGKLKKRGQSDNRRTRFDLRDHKRTARAGW